jgi:ferric-dicitrate binding protein FerR (iron transport regulator)
MPDESRSEQLLAEILATQREHLEEYRRAASQSLDMQRSPVETQLRHVHLHKRLALAGGAIILALLVFVLWLSMSLF